MGDRGQVFIESKGIYLYTHWGAWELIEAVKRALAKRWRWDDHEYLARIIFDEMIGEDFKTETGYGIGTTRHDDIWRLITITKNNKVIVNDNDKIIFNDTFEEFIKWSEKIK